jgi:hypothetical protein
MARPGLWGIAVVTLWRLAAPGWWHRRPFLPLPDADYWHFRMVTAFGGDGVPTAPGDRWLEPGDVVTYLQWCKRMRTRRG